MKKEINYAFIALPINLIGLMDGYCLKLMCILIQKESYWRAHNKLNDGWFIKSITELTDELGLSNKKDTRLVIESLYRASLIEVTTIPQQRHTAMFKLNWKRIEDIASLSMREVEEFEEKIIKLPRTENITYVTTSDTETGTTLGTRLGTNCTTTKDNKENKDNKNNIYNINNNNNNLNNNINNNNLNNILKENIKGNVEEIIDLKVNTHKCDSFLCLRELKERLKNKREKEAVSDSIMHQVEEVPIPSDDSLKSSKNTPYKGGSDYHPFWREVRTEDNIEDIAPIEVVSVGGWY